MMKHISFNTVRSNVGRLLIAAMILSLVAYSPKPVEAGQFTSISDTMTRLKVSTPANHTISLDLEAGTAFDATGGDDIIYYTFPSDFVLAGTFTSADFTFSQDESSSPVSKTIADVQSGTAPQTPDCSGAGADEIAIAVETDTRIIAVEACGTSGYTTSDTAGTLTLAIEGTAPNGTITNPSTTSTAGNKTLSMSLTDETVADASIGYAGLGIVEEDTVTITAVVDAILTFDIDVSTDGSESNPASVPVNLGTLSSGAVTSSNNTSINSIYLDVETNATNGVVVTVENTDSVVDLASIITPADTIDAVGAPPAAVTAGSEGYGICVVGSTIGGFVIGDVGAEYDGDTVNDDGCENDGSDNFVGVPPATGSTDTILSASGPIVGGDVEIAVKAAISGTTVPHDDYTDQIRFIATATF